MKISPAAAATLVLESGLVIVGERHGTNEFPDLVLALAAAAARHRRLTVALELGDDARDATAAFLRSAGHVADRQRLLTAPSWQQRDGRASTAVLRLVDGLRTLIRAGADIDVDVFDASPVGDPHSRSYQIQRERMIAERLLGIRQRSSTVALTGNVHAELVPRADAPDGFVPAAALVAQEATLTTLVGRHSGGESWSASVTPGGLVAGVQRVEGVDRGAMQFVEVDPPSTIRVGVAYVGSITASPPATDA